MIPSPFHLHPFLNNPISNSVLPSQDPRKNAPKLVRSYIEGLNSNQDNLYLPPGQMLLHRTFLPIIWHSFTADFFTEHVPDEIVRRHSHLFKKNRHGSRTPTTVSRSSIAPTFTCSPPMTFRPRAFRAGAGAELQGQNGEQDTVVPFSHSKRLLRSNPCLKALQWAPATDEKQPLDIEDFLGFRSLERLLLNTWNCSDGQLGQVLRWFLA